MAWSWPFSFPPKLDWIQVEISSICPAHCLYCPQSLFKQQWHNALMDEQLYHRLLPVFGQCGLVYLQGWGEPLTHPKFFDFLRLAKSTGCRVGSTSNGMLLDDKQCERMVEEQLDIIGLSLAGTDADNDRIRQGTSLTKVLSLIDNLARIKRRLGTDRPAVHVAYLLVRSGLPTLHRLPDLLRDRGIAQVVLTTTDPFGHPFLREEAFLPDTREEEDQFRQHLDHLVADGKRAGLAIHTQLPFGTDLKETRFHPFDGPPVRPDDRLKHCSENVERAAFVGVTGTVSPCVFTNLPLVPKANQQIGPMSQTDHPPLFGNLNQMSFASIWHGKPYQAFRQAHRSGTPPAFCRHCQKLMD